MSIELNVADKQTLDNVKSKVDSTLDTNINSRATQTSVNTVSTNIGSNADASSATGSVHAKLKDIKTAVTSGGGIKVVQRGITVLPNATGNHNISVTISSVDMSKAFIVMNHTIGMTGSSWSSIKISARLINSTTVGIEGVFGTNMGEFNVMWEVIEFK